MNTKQTESLSVKDTLKLALEALESVLCDPDGNVCWQGSYADRDIIGDALDIFRTTIEAAEKQEPVAWGIFHFGGKRDRKLYTTCDTREQAIAYIADRHQSDDTNTFRAAPIYTSPQPSKPLTDDLYRAIESMIERHEAGDLDGWEVQLVKRRLREAAHGITGETK